MASRAQIALYAANHNSGQSMCRFQQLRYPPFRQASVKKHEREDQTVASPLLPRPGFPH
jgi:hypothetical protein